MSDRMRATTVLMAVLLVSSAGVSLARAESDWLSKSFADKPAAAAEKARKPSSPPAKPVKSAKQRDEEAAAERRDQARREAAARELAQKQAERAAERAAEKAAERTAEAGRKASKAKLEAEAREAAEFEFRQQSGVAAPPPTLPAVADTTPAVIASSASDDRMRLGAADADSRAGETRQVPMPAPLPAATIAPPTAVAAVAPPRALEQPSASIPDRDTQAPPQPALGAAADATARRTAGAPETSQSPAPDGSEKAPAVRLATPALSISPPALAATPVVLTPSAVPVPPAGIRGPADARTDAIARGQRLWHQRRGPRHTSLEGCDLGLGPGRVVGTFAHLPRHFADANRVMDLETRLLWCALAQQEIPAASLLQARSVEGQMATELDDLAGYVISLSISWRLSAPAEHPKERQALAVGQALYARRQGPLDFACASCHGSIDPAARGAVAAAIPVWQGQSVPQFTALPAVQTAVAGGPVWRSSAGRLQTVQGRLGACFAHMEIAPPAPGSDAMVALVAYLTKRAEKGEVVASGRKP